MNEQSTLDQYRASIEQALDEFVQLREQPPQQVQQAMRYSLLGGGKRLRAVLVLEFCRLCGGNWETALPFACALEMVHAYSLIHDDLPCMDNDDMRRGRPSCHIAYGEAIALLAGDALLTKAFETICAADSIPVEHRLEAVHELARAAGTNGMIGGQELDITEQGVDMTSLVALSEKKTGALIRAAAHLGCLAANADGEKKQAADRYAHCLGLSFQVTDDILDEIGDAGELGKPIGSDAQQGKVTFASLLGVERAQQFSDELIAEGLGALQPFGEAGTFLAWLTQQMAHRTK